MSQKFIHSVEKYPKNVSKLFEDFAKNLTNSMYMVDGDINKFIEIGPRQKLSTIFRLPPSTISFEVSFDHNDESSPLKVNFEPLFEGTRFLGLNPYEKWEIKNHIQPRIIKSLTDAIESFDKEENS